MTDKAPATTRAPRRRAAEPATAAASAPASQALGAAPVQRLTPDMVGFRLLKLTNLMSRPFFGQFARQHALSLNEWRAIVVLASRPGSAAQDIAAATGLHPMNVSRAVINLRRSGLVEEARDPDNHRRVLLWLTKAGDKTFRDIAPQSERDNGRLLDVLTPDELTALGRALDKLIARAEEITSEG